LTVEPEEHLFQQIYGDQNRFEQIFINFVSNALKFTPEGGTVEVKLVSKKLYQAGAASCTEDNASND